MTMAKPIASGLPLGVVAVNERMKQRQAVFSAGNANRHAISRTKHREAAHRTTDRIEDFLFHVRHR